MRDELGMTASPRHDKCPLSDTRHGCIGRRKAHDARRRFGRSHKAISVEMQEYIEGWGGDVIWLMASFDHHAELKYPSQNLLLSLR